MDERTYTPTGGDGATAPTAPSIDGRQLSRRLRRLSPAKRALVAHELEHGSLHNLTGPQAVAVTRVSLSYLNSVRRASDEERKRLAYGWLSLSTLHNQYRTRPVTDADVERIVRKIGADRVLSVLDRITAPLQTRREIEQWASAYPPVREAAE